MSTVRRFTQLDVFTAEPLKGNPLAVVHDAQGLERCADGRLRTLDQPQRDHLPAAAHASRRRLPRAHLHAGPRAAFRRPPDARQLPRLAAGGRAQREGEVVQECGVGRCASCAVTARGSRSPRRRCVAAARSTRPRWRRSRALEDPARRDPRLELGRQRTALGGGDAGLARGAAGAAARLRRDGRAGARRGRPWPGGAADVEVRAFVPTLGCRRIR